MKMHRHFLFSALLCLTLTAFKPPAVFGNSSDDELSIKVTPIQANLYLLQGRGGNVLGFTANIEAVLALIDDNTVVVPGHGSLATKAELQAYHDMLVTTTQLVQ
ncbi:MAG: hypothetical protein AAGF35_11695, partial [Pseudomonadota bacterium]